MELIDTHCHLCHARLRANLPDILHRAQQAGVTMIIAAAGDLDESAAALALAGACDGIRCMAGVHPHEAAAAPADYVRRVRALSSEAMNVAVGEVGLDYHYDFSPRAVQRRVFAEQLALAVALDKPVVIHTREAFDDTLAILAESGVSGERVVFHSFTGGESEARRALKTGATLSFSGIATFRNAGDIRRAVVLCPPERRLIETDAPYLSPEPVRGQKTNEPANVAHVARALAEALGVPPEAFAERATSNARRVFGL